jgi:hypothetical protein
MNLEQSLAQHYTHGALQEAIFNALLASGKKVSRLEQADLAPVDEFHRERTFFLFWLIAFGSDRLLR